MKIVILDQNTQRTKTQKHDGVKYGLDGTFIDYKKVCDMQPKIVVPTVRYGNRRSKTKTTNKLTYSYLMSKFKLNIYLNKTVLFAFFKEII